VARILPLTRAVDLTSRRGSFRVLSRLTHPERYTFTVDMYSHLRESHPDTHVGYWTLPLPAGETVNTFHVDLTTIGVGSVQRESVEGRQRPIDSWTNPHYEFDPLIGIQLVLRKNRQVLENRFITGKVADPAVLRSYYHRVHADQGYTPAEPFLHELHAAMLRRLDRIFRQYIPQASRVLDVGCGRSLFTEIRARWPFMLVAADVEHGLLCERRAEFGHVQWVTAGAVPLPFRGDAFHALFAGELIEHLVDPRVGLAEFRRVLQPRGVLILTTPNRRRLANVVDGSDRPYSPDHLSELTYDEVQALLAEEGFEVLESTGVHLELLLNWFSRQPKLDRLQRGWNRPWAVPLMRALLPAGALLPRYALDRIFVARKRAPGMRANLGSGQG
jgi:2-polyprenyl-3-methyl-5-hydroxy-6-metoxy-1,4-benzoquinol methylase